VGRSRKYFSQENAIYIFFIVGGIDVAVNNLKVFSVAMQQLQVCRNTFFLPPVIIHSTAARRLNDI
jgi:hypothetical protein